MRKLILVSAVATFMFFMGQSNTFAQGPAKHQVTVEAKDVQASRGTNPNIKGERPATDEASSRGTGYGTCEVYFDNYTSYNIDVYVDGYWRGTLSAYGAGTINVGSGYTTIYMISTGKTKEWYADGDCNGNYTYTIK